MEPISSLPYNAGVADRDFKYYIFDWDDNILHMPTRIHLEHLEDDGTWRPVKVSTSLFAVVRTDGRYRLPEKGGRKEAFIEFQDTPQDRGRQFLLDTAAALRRISEGEKPGPSFETMKRTLIEGRVFAIVTARGHASSTLRRAVRLFIDTVLTPEERETMMRNLRGYRVWLDKVTEFGTDDEELEYYLSMCRFHAVTNADFWGQMESDPDFGTRLLTTPTEQRPEMAKKFAIHDFVVHVFHMLERTGGFVRPVAIGFSDDDLGNVRAVADYVTSELSSRFPGIKFVVYDTSDATLSRGRKVVVAGQLNLPGF